MKAQDNPSEKLFAALCGSLYLKGFVFHSPRYKDPTEQEAGDVVLWVRTDLIVFEIVWRNVIASANTKSFIKQIGRKRDQLVKDYEVYGNTSKPISMINEAGEKVSYDHNCFVKQNFCGVVLVDSDVPLERLHIDTVRKSMAQEFPIAIMTKQDFTDLLIEIDTTSDLFYYLKDRKVFLCNVFEEDPSPFLDLNLKTERALIGFSKLNENSFPIDRWRAARDRDFWRQYQHNYAERINARNEENAESYIFDEITDLLRNNNSPIDSTLLHSWELAILPRRVRAELAKKLNAAFEGMVNQRSRRHFSFYNPITCCWSIFYFRYGGDKKIFVEEATMLARMKMQVERIQNDFRYSVFCYAFRKLSIITGNTFDDCVLRIEGADNYQAVSPDQYQEAQQYFRGTTGSKRVQEFPS
jgi:hypothetical protein